MELNKNLSNLLFKIDILNKNQILNGLVSPVLRDYYGWDRENIEDVETGDPLSDGYDLLLKGSVNLISVRVLSDLTELNNYLEELISNTKNSQIRFQLILVKGITKFYDAKHRCFKENVDFYRPSTLQCIHIDKEPFLSNEFDFDIIESSIDLLKSESGLKSYLLSNTLDIDSKSIQSFNEHFHIGCFPKAKFYLKPHYVNIKDIDLNRTDLLIETALIEFAIADQFNVLLEIKNNESKKHWSTGYSYILDFLFMLNIDLTDPFFERDRELVIATLSQTKNQFIENVKTTVIIQKENTYTAKKIAILLSLLEYLEEKRNLSLDIYINYERRINKND